MKTTAELKLEYGEIFAAYLATALQLCEDYDNQIRYQEDGDEEKRSMTEELIAPESLVEIENEVADFIRQIERYIDNSNHDLEQIGIDFWLTRNGHGAGFFDRTYAEAPIFDGISRLFKEVDLYWGDDGKIYLGAG